MKTNDDIESYLISLDMPYEELEEGLWIVHADSADIVIAHTPPVIVFRVKVYDLPPQNREALYRKLLDLNAQELVHGAFGIEDDVVVLTEALQSENLDTNEFQAAIESLAMAVVEHHEALAPYQPQPST